MSYALVFAGQASQHAAMLPWLEARPASAAALQAMAQHLGPHWRQTLQDPQARSANAFAQVLVTGTSLAAWAALQPLLSDPPAVVAGYSVGELAAYACAGVLSPDQAIALAAERARQMDQAASGKATGLLSISGVTPQQVLSQHPALACAIRIDEDHAIFGATPAQLDAAAQELAKQGAICKPLAIALASHTAHMEAARQGFANVLQEHSLHAPQIAVVTNATGEQCRRVADLREMLSRQVSTTVQWAASMDAIAERGVHCVLEIGAGNALAALWNRRHPEIPARALEDFKDPAAACAWVHSHP